MASNPMQRKSRNSFLLGMIITLLISSMIIGVLFIQLKKKSEQLKAELDAKVMVYALSQDVKAGQILTEDMFEMKQIHRDSIPSNATAVAEVVGSWFLQTKAGEAIYTDQEGLYLKRMDDNSDTIVEIFQNDGTKGVIKDKDNKVIAVGEKYTCINGVRSIVPSNVKEIEDENGAFYVDKNDEQTRVFEERATGEFYVYKINQDAISTSNAVQRVKEYIDIKDVPVLAKVAMNANTVITPNLIVQSDEVITDDVRQQEYNMIVLPVDLMTDDYVDIRLMTPSGQDFIVVSKAKIDVPMNADNTYLADTIRMNLREDEILAMSSAIVEAYGLLGSKLYATKYVEAGMQEPSMPTYTPNAAVTAQIDPDQDGKIDNPNIVQQAMAELSTRYNPKNKKIRNEYLQSLIDQSQDYTGNVQSKQTDESTKQNAARQRYLESLNY